MMTKFFVFLVTTLCLSFSLRAQQYKPVADSSSVDFKIKNFGIAVSGTVKGMKGAIQFDPQNATTGSFTVSLDAQTVNTGIEMRDAHLKKDDYLDVAQFPQITFTSTKITSSTKPGYLFIFGNLTLKGVTKAVSFPFQAEPNGNGYVFSGSFSINRRDFGVGGSSISMSDQVLVELKVLARPVQ